MCLRRVLERALSGADPCSGEGVSGLQLMITSKHTCARALSVMSGKCRRSSITPDSSPPSWQAWRIAWVVASSTANIAGAWTCLPGRSKQTFCDRRAAMGTGSARPARNRWDPTRVSVSYCTFPFGWAFRPCYGEAGAVRAKGAPVHPGGRERRWVQGPERLPGDLGILAVVNRSY